MADDEYVMAKFQQVMALFIPGVVTFAFVWMAARSVVGSTAGVAIGLLAGGVVGVGAFTRFTRSEAYQDLVGE